VPYSTTKHAVVGLSKSLRAEAAHLGIRVSVFCPGFVRTAILDEGGKYGKTLMDLSDKQKKQMENELEKYKPIDPDVFAPKALDAVAKNKAIIIIPSWWKFFWWYYRLFPNRAVLASQKKFDERNKNISAID